MTYYLRHPSNAATTVRLYARPIALFVAVTSAALATLALPSGAATVHQHAHTAKPPSPATLISRTQSAVASVSAVHLKVTATQTSPKLSETISQDAGLATGDQYVISGKERANVLLTKTDAYLSGNSTGLTTFFALPADDESLVGSKWILIKKGTSPYTTFVTSITVKSLLKNLLPTTKSLKVHNTTYGSTPAYEIDWSVTSSGTTTKLTLTLPRAGKSLPLAESAISGATSERSVLTNWNKLVTIHAPSNTIPITQLHSS